MRKKCNSSTCKYFLQIKSENLDQKNHRSRPYRAYASGGREQPEKQRPHGRACDATAEINSKRTKKQAGARFRRLPANFIFSSAIRRSVSPPEHFDLSGLFR